ncbi:MAG: helix-turn-helix domain-containing protein [Pseudomonas sp.]|uniref:helix-turn-helix domain-containing protein n=1 Tax=Pseudomonas sp. TaxID=306 RepID=UPI003D6E5A1F
MDKKKANHKASRKEFPLQNTSINAQLARLVERLRAGQSDTFTITRELNICRPGARICDLRNRGFKILTNLVSLTDEWGRTHPRVAMYTLIAEPGAEVAA